VCIALPPPPRYDHAQVAIVLRTAQRSVGCRRWPFGPNQMRPKEEYANRRGSALMFLFAAFAAAQAPLKQQPHATVAQLMRGVFFPNSNTPFDV
jgi:hypothetical protein